MTINWSALAIVAVVALCSSVLVVVLVSVALVGLSARELNPPGQAGRTLSPAGGTVLATLCLSVAAAIILYGLYLLVF